MTNQLSIGLILDLGKTNKAMVIAVNSPVTITIPKGYDVLIEAGLEEQNVKSTVSGKVKFPKNGKIFALVTLDPKFRQARVESADPVTLRTAVSEAVGGIDVQNLYKRLETFFKSLPKDGLAIDFFNRLFGISLDPLRKIRDDFTEKMGDVDFDAILDELNRMVEANKDKFPDSATDEDD